MTVKDIYSFINSIAPFSTQAQWDNSGLIIGDINAEVTRAYVCLDVTLSEVNTAKELGAELIISHHPVIFNAQKSFLSNSVSYKLAQYNISVISAHTNLDKAPGGVNDTLCKALLMNYEKLPFEIAEGYLNAGSINGINNAFELCEHIKKQLNAAVRYCDAKNGVSKIAVCSGSGTEFIAEAQKHGCNAFITGDASYHAFSEAAELGVSLFAAGHYETENLIVNELTNRLNEQFIKQDIKFVASKRSNPVITEI